MNLIQSVEVAYFRSVYKQRLDDLGGLTVFFGRNDSGKSNFLRALNLFFEGHTNPGMPFNFARDFNDGRLAEVSRSDGARKFVYVKVHFVAPPSWRNSLGSSFWVKKQWSVNKVAVPGFETSVPPSKQHYLTRFLNKVKFHYVPAIKDRSIFERLLSRVYLVLSSQKEFNDALDAFAVELKAKTEQLSEGLLGAVGVNSTIAPPRDLTELFRSLDFETEGRHGDKYSLTLQRGDGVQVRHIPEILSFLSDRGGEDYHVWGFEEPENSLELASAIEEARRFLALSESANKQIFVTSHSPAFFRLDQPGVRRYFVSKVELPRISRDVSEAKYIQGLDPESLPADLMGETPHLVVISSYLNEAAAKIDGLECQARELVARVEEAATPILFVEGESDKKVLQAAWDAFVGSEHELTIEYCEGTSKMESLAANGAVLHRLAPERSMFVLVDNDCDGRQLRRDARLSRNGGRWIQHNSNKTWWCRLYTPQEFVDQMTSLGIRPERWPGTLENIFSREVRMRAMAAGAYALGDSPFDDLLNGEDFRKIRELLNGSPEEQLYVVAPTPETKGRFADWLVEQSNDDRRLLEPLRAVVVDLFGRAHGRGSSGLERA